MFSYQGDKSISSVENVLRFFNHFENRMTTEDFKDDTVSKLAKREGEMAEMRSTIEKMADKIDKESREHEETKKRCEELIAKATKLEQQLNVEMVSRMKLEEVVKEFGSSIPDDAKIANLASMGACLLYTSPSPRDKRQSRMPSSA